MGFQNREIEVKLLAVDATSYTSVCNFVETVISELCPRYNIEDDLVVGNATDIYWSAPRDGMGDFVRLRKTAKGGQITLKSSDKGNNVDRVEIDLEVHDYKQAKELMLALHGKPKETVTKKYQVYFLENEYTNVSVYQVKGDDRVFVEVEAKTKQRVKQIVKALLTPLPHPNKPAFSSLTWVQSSIYNMFVQKKKAKEADLKEFLE